MQRFFLICTLSLLLAAAISQALPFEKAQQTKIKPGLQHRDPSVEQQFQLQSPIDNLVEPDEAPASASASFSDVLLPPPPPEAQQPQPQLIFVDDESSSSSDEEDEEVDVFPDRQGFITGHQIPTDVLEQNKYVDSSDFRGRLIQLESPETTTTTTTTTTTERRLPRPRPVFENRGLGGGERDPTYLATLDSFVPYF